MVKRTRDIMSTQELLFKNLQNSYNLLENHLGIDISRGTNSLSIAFGHLLKSRLNEITIEKDPYFKFASPYCFTSITKGGLFYTSIYEMNKGPHGGYYMQPENDDEKITILLHGGLRSEFLSDLYTWGSNEKTDNIPYSSLRHIFSAQEDNYSDLQEKVSWYYMTERWDDPRDDPFKDVRESQKKEEEQKRLRG